MNPYSIEKIPSDILTIVAKNHRYLRKRMKWSQKEIARRSGVSLGSVKRFEQTGEIAFLSLLKLAHVLGRLDDFAELFAVDPNLEAAERLFSDEVMGR